MVAPSIIENPSVLSSLPVDATGASTDAFVIVTGFPIASPSGMVGIGTILNTGAKDLNVRETVTDKFGNTVSKTTVVLAGADYQLNLQTNFTGISTAFPPLKSYEVEVQSNVAGNPTTYELHLAAILL